MTADIATRVYSHKSSYAPRRIDYLKPEEVGSQIAYLRTAPGVSLSSIKDEVFLAANTVDILSQITVVDLGITQTYVSGESGYHITLGQAASGPMSMDYDPRIRSWYLGAKNEGGLYWSEPFIDAFGRGAGVTCAMPFYDESSGKRVMKGVAGCGFILAGNVGKIIDAARIGETGYAFLLDDLGSVVMGTKDAGVNYHTSADSELRLLADLMLSGGTGSIQLVLDGNPVYAAYHPLEAINWSLCVVVSLDEIIAPALAIGGEIMKDSTAEMNVIRRTFIVITLVIFVIILFTTLGAFITAGGLSRSLTGPIITLSQGARLIGEGNLDHRLEVKSGDEVEELSETFNKMITGIKNATAEKQRIQDELTFAADIQQSMLPSVAPRFTGRQSFELAAKMVSAKEVGGDFYDFFFLDGNETKAVFVIADVSGKGVPAALFMVIAKTLIKQHLLRTGDPALAVETANKALSEDNANAMFVTAIAAVLNLETGDLVYVSAGHNAPLLSRGGAPYEFLKKKGGLPLGISADGVYQNERLTLKAGDKFFLYTDGVNEAMNSGEEEWGNERFLEAANRFRALRPADFDGAIRGEIEAFAGGVEHSDDITTLAVAYSGPPVWERRELPARLTEMDALQVWLEARLNAAHCGPRERNHLAVVCEEVFVNIVSYAAPAGSGVGVFFRHDANRVWLRFEDSGPAFDPTLYDTRIQKETGGRGIRLIRACTNAVFYERRDNRNLLTLVKEIAV